MKASVQLRLARAIATHPDTRGTGWYAKDANGNRVDPDNDNACRWCALGALALVSDIKVFDSSSDLMESPAGRLLNEAAKRVSNNYTVAGVHDDMDSDTNEHMWSVAIELAEAEEAAEQELESSGKAVRACNLQPGQRVIIPDNDTDPTKGVAITVGRAAAALDMIHVYPIEDDPTYGVRYFSVRKDRLLYLAEPEPKRVDHLPANQVRPRMYVMHEDQARLVKEVQFYNPHWVRLVFVPMPVDLAQYWDVQVHELVDVVGETEPKPVYVKIADLQPGSLFVYPHNDGDTINLKGLICELDEESDALGLYGFRRLALRVHGEPVRHYRNLRETDLVELISVPKIEFVQGVPLTYDDFHKTGQAQRLLDPLAHVHTGEAIVPKTPRKILVANLKPGMRINDGIDLQPMEYVVTEVRFSPEEQRAYVFWGIGENSFWKFELDYEVALLSDAPEPATTTPIPAPRKILAKDVKPGMRIRGSGWQVNEITVLRVTGASLKGLLRLFYTDEPEKWMGGEYWCIEGEDEVELISESNLEPEGTPHPKMLIAYLEEAWEKRDTHTLIMDGVVVRNAGQWGDGPVEVTVFDENPFPICFREQDLIVVGGRVLAKDTDGDEHWFALRDGPHPDSDIRVTDVKVDGVPVKFRGAENTDDTPPFELFAGTSKALDELGKQLRARAMAEAAAADGSIVHDSTGQVVKPVPVTGNEIAGCNCCICEYYRNSQQDEHPTGGPDIEKDMLVAKLEALMLGLFEGAVEPDDDEDVIDVHVIVIAG